MGVVGCRLPSGKWGCLRLLLRSGRIRGLPLLFLLQLPNASGGGTLIYLSSIVRAPASDASFALGPPPTAPDQSPITRTSTITITISRLPKKLCDEGLFFQELPNSGVDLVAAEVIQTHVLHHFAAVITGGPDRERADDPLLHSVAAI